jgi:hypothetical protein
MIYAYDLFILIRMLAAWIKLFSYFQWLGSLLVPNSKIKIIEIASIDNPGWQFTTFGKHIHDGLILLRGVVSGHTTCLTSKRAIASTRPSQR